MKAWYVWKSKALLLRIYDVISGTAAVQTLTNVTTVSLTLSNQPVVLELAQH